MSLNQVTLEGRLVFEKKFTDGEKPFIMWNISVRRDYKKQDESYYPEDVVPVKAWSGTAKFLNDHFQTGSSVILTGRLEKSDNYVDTAGETKYGQLYLNISQAYFAGSKSESEGSAPTSKAAPAANTPAKKTTASAGKNPLAKRGNPFANK